MNKPIPNLASAPSVLRHRHPRGDVYAAVAGECLDGSDDERQGTLMRALAEATMPNAIGQKPFRGKNTHRRINPAGLGPSTSMIAHPRVASADRNPVHGLPNSLL